MSFLLKSFSPFTSKKKLNVATSLNRFLASGSFMISFRPSIPNWFFEPKSSLPVHAGASSQIAAQLKTTFSNFFFSNNDAICERRLA